MDERRNARLVVGSLTLTKAGDAVVDAKAVLPFPLAAGGAPEVLTGLLVPIRESGSLLPQAALTPLVQRVQRRRLAWSLGSVVQGAAVGVMALVATRTEGVGLGVGITLCLAVFALARSLSSIAFKDVMGRSISKGTRGRVTGRATSAAGAVALTLGIGLRLTGQNADITTFAWLLLAAAISWLAAAALFSRIDEEAEQEASAAPRTVKPWRLLREDAAFRRFVGARTLLLASALSPPYLVSLAVQETDASLGQLGPFVVASGVAALVGGRVWGARADRSSRHVMAAAAGLAALLISAFLLLRLVTDLREALPLYVASHFLLNLVHAGARVGRSTYVVDFADGDLRTVYVGASNTAMGALLLVVGAIVGAVASISTVLALCVLVAIGVAGVPASLSLPRTVTKAG